MTNDRSLRTSITIDSYEISSAVTPVVDDSRNNLARTWMKIVAPVDRDVGPLERSLFRYIGTNGKIIAVVRNAVEPSE